MDRFELILLRLKAGLKQYELAALLGIPPTIVCDLERGRRTITPEVEKRAMLVEEHPFDSSGYVIMEDGETKIRWVKQVY